MVKSLPFATYNVAAGRWFITKRPIPQTITLDVPSGIDWLDFICEIRLIMDSMGLDVNNYRIPPKSTEDNVEKVVLIGIHERI